MNNTKAIEKLKESKEHLDLELISQEEYDKIKEELRPFIVLTDDKKSEKINEKLNKLTDKNKIDVTQIEKEPKPLSPPVNLNDIGYLSPMKQWSWTGYWWIDISEMFGGATTKKVLESVENSTTSSTATEQKKTSKWVYIVLVLFFIGFINYMLPWKCAGCNEKITQNSAYNYRGALVDKDMWTGGKNELYHGRCWQADDLFK